MRKWQTKLIYQEWQVKYTRNGYFNGLLTIGKNYIEENMRKDINRKGRGYGAKEIKD